MSTDKNSGEENDHENDVTINAPLLLKKFVAGGLVAACAVTVTAPMERTKLILQIQSRTKNIPIEMRYKGIIDCLIRIPKEQGFLSFWRGNTASVLRCFPYHAFNFSLKDTFREYASAAINPKTVTSHALVNLFAGGLAGSTALLIVYPLDYARTRMAMDVGRTKASREYHTLWGTLKDAYDAHGIKGIYRGWRFSILGVFMYRAIYFGLYDTGVDVLTKEYRTIWMQILLAEFSAITAGFLSYPMDTIRRSMMMQSGKNPKSFAYKSSMQCARMIYMQEGWIGFYKGCVANGIRGIGGALMLIFYDNVNFFILGDKKRDFYKTSENKRVNSQISDSNDAKGK